MRLINAKTYELEEFLDSSTPPYAILSHTWEVGEVLFKDMYDFSLFIKSEELSFQGIEEYFRAKGKHGFVKLKYTCAQALKDRLQYAWVDTCEYYRAIMGGRDMLMQVGVKVA